MKLNSAIYAGSYLESLVRLMRLVHSDRHGLIVPMPELSQPLHAVISELLATADFMTESDNESIRAFAVILLVRIRQLYRREGELHSYSHLEIKEALRMIEENTAVLSDPHLNRGMPAQPC